jgi:hypothetical protein
VGVLEGKEEVVHAAFPGFKQIEAVLSLVAAPHQVTLGAQGRLQGLRLYPASDDQTLQATLLCLLNQAQIQDLLQPPRPLKRYERALKN